VARETPIDYYRLSQDDMVRKPNKLYVIAAEGDRTEFKYFEAVRDKYSAKFTKLNWHLEILRRPSKQRGKSSPKDVEQMLNDFLEDNRDYDLKSYDELWLIIDTDTWEPETIKQLAEKCQFDTLYHLGLSNPCFELWLILHLADFNDDVRKFDVTNAPNVPLIKKCIERFKNNNGSDLSIKKCIEETTSHKKRAKTCKQLVELIRRTHNISSIPEGLIDYIPQAIHRSKKLGEQCNPSDDNYPQNICTSVYKLLETLT
jgi:predicted small metal-binding protein